MIHRLFFHDTTLQCKSQMARKSKICLLKQVNYYCLFQETPVSTYLQLQHATETVPSPETTSLYGYTFIFVLDTIAIQKQFSLYTNIFLRLLAYALGCDEHRMLHNKRKMLEAKMNTSPLEKAAVCPVEESSSVYLWVYRLKLFF